MVSPSQRDLTVLVSLTGIATLVYWFAVRSAGKSQDKGSHTSDTDPPLLKKHSVQKSYYVEATGFTYPSIRTFYRPHSQADKLPSRPLPLPLTVFIHGLGGSAAQFGPILTSLINAGPCLAIDLPGCGLSEFAPQDWGAYTTRALVHLIAVVIEQHRDVENNQGIIFVGHSMGCSLAATLASSKSKGFGKVTERALGLVAMCPRVTPLSDKDIKGVRSLVRVPSPIFNLWRLWDKRGGLDSASVSRYAGVRADTRTKTLQLQYNEQSQTDVLKRVLFGMLPSAAQPQEGLPSEEIWAGIDIPVFLIGGGADTVTRPEEVEKLAKILRTTWEKVPSSFRRSSDVLSPEDVDKALLKPNLSLKVRIIPDATHALIYATESCRVISGFVEEFLADRVDRRLSLGWQLQQLSTEGKWEVKNLAKWQKIQNVSEPIGNVFRAMKTMREVDDRHSPKIFVKEWSGKIWAVVDISHESPVYDPATLDKNGIKYHKFPTVSKLPPTAHEVESFIELIDSLRKSREGKEDEALIAVHCHYGFNRTGFFIVCYLIEREGWDLHKAVEEFAAKRGPGIKHDYFIDTLYARYAGGGRRASLTM